MSSLLLGSQGLVVVAAAAMAISAGTIILFDHSREKYLSIIQLELTKNQHYYYSSLDKNYILKSCLSSGKKKKDSRKKRRRVHFAADVKASNGNGEEYRREYRKLKVYQSL